MVNTSKLKLTLLQQEILRALFMLAGTTMNQRGIANMLHVSAPAVMKALPGLHARDLIKIQQDKASKRWAIELNRENHKVMHLKRVDNLKQLYEFDLVDYLEKEFAGATIILFGSFSRGDDTLSSDIDIAIIGRKEKPVVLHAFENVLQRKININYYADLRSVHKHLKENLCNGIVLVGGVEL